MTDRLKNLADTILQELAEYAGAQERTTVCSGLQVVNAAYAANRILVRGRDGTYEPVLTVPGATYTAGDLVTVLYVKGAEPMALVQSPGSSGSGLPVHDHSSGLTGGKNLHDIEELEFESPTTLTIAAGVITRTQVYHIVDTSGPASEDLNTINGGSDGDLLVIRAANDVRTVVVKHNVGNIWLGGAADISLDDAEDHLALIYDNANSMWCDISGGAAGGLPIHDHSGAAQGGQNLRAIDELEMDDALQLTINAGAITRTQVYHSIETAGGAVTDNLNTINGGVEGDLLIIRPYDDTHTVVVRHNVGNIWLSGGANISLNDIGDHLVLIYDGTNAQWCDIGWSSAGWKLAGDVLVVGPSGDFATFALAVAAAAVGDTILLDVGTWTCDGLTLQDGVNVEGIDKDACILRTTTQFVCLTTGTNNYLANLTIQNEYNIAGANAVALWVGAGKVVELFNVKLYANNANGAAGGAIALGSQGTVTLRQCELDATAAAGTRYGIDNYNILYIYGGSFDGDTFGIVNRAGGDFCYFKTPARVNGFSNAGTIVGDYESDAGDSNRWGHIFLADAKDVYPNDDQMGFARRFVNPPGLTNWTSHFRTGDAAGAGELAAYAWQGAPFSGVPAALFYSTQGEWFRATANGAGQRHFMSKAIANNAAAWQGKLLNGRLCTSITTEIGFRFDAGNDNNYVEIYFTGAAGDATQRLNFRYRDNGGVINTVTSNLIVPVDTSTIVQLLCYFSAPNYTAYGYVVNEVGSTVNVTGFAHLLTGNWAVGPPTAGRAGIFVKDAGGYAMCDWFYNTFE